MDLNLKAKLEEIIDNSNEIEEMKGKLKNSLNNPPRESHEPWIYRLATFGIFLLGMTCVAGIIFLAIKGTTIPDAITAVSSAAVGALTGLLGVSRSG